ncbi:unnamed protein product [Victoria cruziana]
MWAAARKLFDAVLLRRSHCLPASLHHSCTRSLRHAATTPRSSSILPSASLLPCWTVIQSRGAKVLGTDVRLGNIIQRKGRIYQVLKAQHTQHGRGGATIQVELRDVDNGNKVTERFRTDEAVENNMTVTLQFYDGKPMSASIPQRVTCTVVEAQPVAKGQTASPQYKRVGLDNGLTVLVPAFIKTGDLIVVNTTDDSYMTRA